MNALRLLRLILREGVLPANLARIPEPTAKMTSNESIAGFNEQGISRLLPIYRFNALAIDRLAPKGARVVDLGCGSGQFLAYLAARRPDLDITGLDLSEGMVTLGRRQLKEAGLADRVRLLQGDMREFRRALPAPPDVVGSVFSLHHLTSGEDLRACLAEIAAAVAGERAGLWIFDHVRPRRRRTAVEVPEIFTPLASPAFRADSHNSLRAAWSYAELGAALRAALPVRPYAVRSRLLPLYQIYWTAPLAPSSSDLWREDPGPASGVRAEATILERLFPVTPVRPRRHRASPAGT